jgi:shikimate kinase
MSHPDKLYIIGFMGSGKTTAGRKLARLLNWKFIDLDKAVEQHTGLTIPEIFSGHGEAWFRKAESEVLRNLEPEPKLVISTGGGAPCFEDNMDYMLSTGLTIYLKLTPEQLKMRLSRSKGERPLVKGLKDMELQNFIEEKLEFREKWYNKAELTFKGFDIDIQSVFDRVRTLLDS